MFVEDLKCRIESGTAAMGVLWNGLVLMSSLVMLAWAHTPAETPGKVAWMCLGVAWLHGLCAVRETVNESGGLRREKAAAEPN